MMGRIKLWIIIGLASSSLLGGGLWWVGSIKNENERLSLQINNERIERVRAEEALESQRNVSAKLLENVQILDGVVTEMDEQLRGLRRESSSLSNQIEELRRQDEDVDTYLSTPVPSALVDRLFK